MRISDWSSDVCSSDLLALGRMRRNLEDALNHVGEENRVVTFPEKLLACGQPAAAADHAEPGNFRCIEIGADRAIADRTAVAIIGANFLDRRIHAPALELPYPRGKRFARTGQKNGGQKKDRKRIV